MPPMGGGKRKRGDRSYSGDDFQRPSPHRPGNLPLAQQNSPYYGRDYSENRGRGGRRASRGGRGAYQQSINVNGTPETLPPAPQAQSQDRQEPVQTNGDAEMSPEPLEDEPIPESETKPFNYVYVTEDIAQDWTKTGRQAILSIGAQAVEEDDDSILSTLIQELVQSCLSGRLSPSDAGEAMKQMMTSEDDEDDNMTGQDLYIYPTQAQAAFVDTICIYGEAKSDISSRRLSELIMATGISKELLRQELDATLLQQLGLIRSTFARMGIRKQTNILYRQANFNLMREESEGFAKLMTELFSISENEPPSAEVVGETVEKVKAMIGSFDLDVGRSLDIVLDVFGSVLVKHSRFFVKFLRSSPWWPRDFRVVPGQDTFDLFAGLPQWALPSCAGWHLTEEQQEVVEQEVSLRDQRFWVRLRQVGLQAFFELGRKIATDEEIQTASVDEEGQTLVQAWIKETGTLPPSGNRDAAQLLGFKLRFYSSSAARDENDVLPDNLIYLSALLIKIGFISLTDLYPHIWRSDEGMDELKKLKVVEKAERERAARPGAGAKNALLMAGALADDTLPIPGRLREGGTRAGTPSKEVETDKATPVKPQEPADQKVLLTKSLLAIGALPEALFILGRFPWLLDLYPELPEYFTRIIHHSLSQIYSTVQPLANRDSLQEQKPTSETGVPGMPKGQVRLVEATKRKVLKWPLLDRDDSSDGNDYRFYWDEWNDNVPICQTMDDVFLLCDTFLQLVGVKIGQDPVLLLKLARIGKHSMGTDQSDSNTSRWLNLSKRFLVPALSLTKSNAGVVNEVYDLISHFPTNVRYLMYLEWFSGRTSRNPDIKTASDQARAETKDILKRISKTNIKPMARSLAKIAFANPHIVTTTALAQIEVYDSIAEVFVEGARYFTDLGYDVLTWAMISSMAREGRSRTGESGLFTSKWLSALSAFAGKIFKRYNIMRPGPILQYVEDQLSRGSSGDLVVLEQIISSMAGIASDANYNDAQLQAMGGGALLQSQTLIQLLDRRHDSKASSRRLLRSLRENNLTGKFLVGLAFQRQACIYDREYNLAPLKFVANLFDEVHQILIQYLELLRANLTLEEFRTAVPDIVQLLVDYQIAPEVAFWISRPTIARQMLESDKEATERKKAGGQTVTEILNGDIDMTDEASTEEDGEEVEVEVVTEAISTPTPAEISGSSLEMEVSEKQENLPIESEAIEEKWHPVLHELMEAVGTSLPPDVQFIIGSGFYVTFWQLSLYDIVIPGKSYEDELSRQHKKIAAINADRSDVSVTGVRKKEAEKKQISALIDKLLAENKDHLKSFAESKARLATEKNQWFLGKGRIYEQLNSALMEYCFLPRILASPLDSYFCFRFVKFLHAAGTPNFRTLGFYDLIFKQDRLASLIFMCTPKEADNLGRYLNETLRDLGRWHRDKAVYEREAFGTKRSLPGFALKLDGGRPAVFCDYESFRRVLFKWHQCIFNAMQSCFSSTEYMHIRNAISVLRCISGNFPSINFHGTQLLKLLEDLQHSDKEDLQISSRSLVSTLRNQEKSWMIPQAFRKGQEKKEDNNAVKSEGPQKAGETTSDVVSADVSKVKDEDGEVSDAAMVDVETKETTKEAERSIAIRDPKEPETKPASQTVSETNGTTPAPTRTTRPPPSRDVKSQELPKRVSSPPTSRSHPDLPSRPEPGDRGLTREGQRLPPRPQYSQDSRHPSDSRLPPHSRLGRGERIPEPFDRSQEGRIHDRGPGRPSSGREEYPSRSERNMRGPPDDRYLRQDRETGPPSHSDRSTRPREVRNERPEAPPQTIPTPTRPAETDAVAINPDRAALIGVDSRLNMSIRGQAQEKSSHSSRPSSPHRSDDRRRHDREDDRRAREPHLRGPTGHPSARNDRGPPYESRQQYHSRPVDMQHGRLEQDFSNRPGSQGQDRPNGEGEVPSGPRNQASTSGPRSRGPPPRVNTEASSTTERPTPTGPSARSHVRNNSYTDRNPQSPPAESVGVHPDRLNQIMPSASDPRAPIQPRTAPPTPTVVQVQPSPPVGPRGGNAPVGAPSGPSPTSRGPPSGPQNPNDIAVRGRNRHPLNAVNSTLQQASGASIRGRGGRPSNGPVPISPQMNPPTNGQNTRSEGFVPPESRGDLFAQSGSQRGSEQRRPEDGRRSSRHGRDESDGNREGRDERQSNPRSSRREEDGRGYSERSEHERRGGERDMQPRKHPRGEDGASYGPGSRGASRAASETKRRRGG